MYTCDKNVALCSAPVKSRGLSPPLLRRLNGDKCLWWKKLLRVRGSIPLKPLMSGLRRVFSFLAFLHRAACTPLCCFDGARLNPTKTTYVRTCVFSTSPSKEKHGYWTFEYLLSLFLCDSDQVFNHILQEDL